MPEQYDQQYYDDLLKEAKEKGKSVAFPHGSIYIHMPELFMKPDEVKKAKTSTGAMS